MSSIIEWHRIDTEDDLPPGGSHVLITRQNVRDDGSLFRVVCSASLYEANPGSEYKGEHVKFRQRAPGYVKCRGTRDAHQREMAFFACYCMGRKLLIGLQGEP